MRSKPYTQTGVRRLKCIRCGAKAETQWQICADGNQYRPICKDCDIALNEMVLKFMGFSNANELMDVYRRKMKKEE